MCCNCSFDFITFEQHRQGELALGRTEKPLSAVRDDYGEIKLYKNAPSENFSEGAVHIGVADTCKAVLTGVASSDLSHYFYWSVL